MYWCKEDLDDVYAVDLDNALEGIRTVHISCPADDPSNKRKRSPTMDPELRPPPPKRPLHEKSFACPYRQKDIQDGKTKNISCLHKQWPTDRLCRVKYGHPGNLQTNYSGKVSDDMSLEIMSVERISYRISVWIAGKDSVNPSCWQSTSAMAIARGCSLYQRRMRNLFQSGWRRIRVSQYLGKRCFQRYLATKHQSQTLVRQTYCFKL